MRTAIAVQLKTITDFSNRVFQAYTAPANTAKPYCTFKLTMNDPSVNNMKGEFLGLQVFIYNTKSTFTTLDGLAKQVKTALDKVTLTIDDSPARYFRPEYVRIQADFYDDVADVFLKRIDFIIPLYR